MDFISQMVEKAKRAPKSIVFPESCEDKVLQAARRVLELGSAHPVLVGAPAQVEEAARAAGVPLDGFAIVDHTDEGKRASLVADYLSRSEEYSEKTLHRKLKAPLPFAAAMVKCGWADCLAAGYTCSTGDVAYISQMFIGMRPGITTVSSMGIVETGSLETSEGHLLALTDAAICPMPDQNDLADIAITTADSVKQLLGWEPRVAMLSFSTKGSASHDMVEKVRQATQTAQLRRPDLAIDGELQLDAAILPAVAAKKVKEDSSVAGKANVIVFPDLNAGNIGVKLIQIFGKCLAYGPILQGFARPVTDFSRGAPLDEIVGNLAMLVVMAQEFDG